MKYSALVESSKKIKLFIQNELKLKTSGRFDYYLQIVSELADAFENNTINNLAEKYPVISIGFALKELQELVSIFDFAQKQLKTIRKEEIEVFVTNLKTVLSGPAMTENEKPENSHARNYQFELRLAAKFYNAGYTNISYSSGHDLVVKILGRKYAIECKRVNTDKTKVIIKRTNEAIAQLETNKNYYAGIVALDITQKFEQGVNWIVSRDRKRAADFVAGTISNLLDEIYRRDAKIKVAAQDENIVMMIGNLSCAYLIEPKKDLGWFQQSMFFILNQENRTQANTTKSDLSKLKIIEH